MIAVLQGLLGILAVVAICLGWWAATQGRRERRRGLERLDWIETRRRRRAYFERRRGA